MKQNRKIDGNKLLSREDFKTACFERDNHTCIFCDKPAIDAHHIIERKLFDDGGYYLNNVASVCEDHHIACERTLITVEEVYKAAKITDPKRPEYFETGLVYDKWGNIIVSDVKRIPGLLFEDTAVQKIFKNLGTIWMFY
jgi:hypothetical protein